MQLLWAWLFTCASRETPESHHPDPNLVNKFPKQQTINRSYHKQTTLSLFHPSISTLSKQKQDTPPQLQHRVTRPSIIFHRPRAISPHASPVHPTRPPALPPRGKLTSNQQGPCSTFARPSHVAIKPSILCSPSVCLLRSHHIILRPGAPVTASPSGMHPSFRAPITMRPLIKTRA